MAIDSHQKIGSFYTTHCEDSLIATSLTMDVDSLRKWMAAHQEHYASHFSTLNPKINHAS